MPSSKTPPAEKISDALQEYVYQDLVDASNKNNPIEVSKIARIKLEGLNVKEYYVVEFYFWSDNKQELMLEIVDPNTGHTSLVKKFNIDRSLSKGGKDNWTIKRYKIDKTRHSGSCWIYLRLVDESATFKMVAAPLTSKVIVKNQKINNGLCPTCGVPGHWLNMAMVCKIHGTFIGG